MTALFGPLLAILILYAIETNVLVGLEKFLFSLCNVDNEYLVAFLALISVLGTQIREIQIGI